MQTIAALVAARMTLQAIAAAVAVAARTTQPMPLAKPLKKQPMPLAKPARPMMRLAMCVVPTRSVDRNGDVWAV
ncbi:MAG: hypothetical protein ACREBY_05360 [Polaromonas sp.]